MSKYSIAAAAIFAVGALAGGGLAEPSRAGWKGPISGPAAAPGKSVVFIGSDFKNGGVVSIFRSFEAASREVGWKVSMRDGRGDLAQRRRDFAEAVASRPDGIVLGGFQAADVQASLRAAAAAGVVLVGWHAAEAPGPTKELFVNVATDTEEVARMAAEYLVGRCAGKAGAVIFNDGRFEVANAKTRIMRRLVELAPGSSVLAVEDIPISAAAVEVPRAVLRLDRSFGKAWNCCLAINDVYFDNINIPLERLGRLDVSCVSAGDGSDLAVARIRSGLSRQAGTVADPLEEEGWQIVDELNRAFSGYGPSGYVCEPRLITTEKLRGEDGGPSRAFQAAYRAIWRGKR